ncbi:MAG TPA: hypothetical protein PK752_00935 [Accumulibacter sp.]|uniref:hypothetical protein n=1 Tax=Accumulibacter sp. TaxID=2053492 RepID=UPI002CE5DBBA|nr:hypothetical protein [Accumulibacter sp.]HRD86812.1 hypothetical protein [Accumulibacter sp.]
MGYAFDGAAKTVTLTSGTTVLDLIDLHSRWKDWVRAGNAAVLPAFRAVGGDIPAIPLYLFLLNGWNIVPQAADHTLRVISGVFEREGGGDPFVDPAGSYKIRINRETPGIAIGYSTSGGSGYTLEQIGQAVGNRIVEGPLSADGVARVLLSVLTGKVTGAGSGTEVFRDLSDSKARVTVTVDSVGNRSGVTLDAE